MAFTGNRPLSPSMHQQHLSFRLTGNSAGEDNVHRRTSYKGKERVVEDTNEPPSPSLYTFVPRPPSASGMPGGTSAPTSPSSKRSSILSTASSSSSRNSALLEFSPFKFGRKKKPSVPRQNPNMRMNLVLPDVLEISAANSLSTTPAGEDVNTVEDEETRERIRLREEAAQALGLSTATHHTHTGDDHSESGHSVTSNGTLREDDKRTNISDQEVNSSYPNDTHHYHFSHFTSTTSLHPPLSPTSSHGRNRSGSMPAAYPSNPPPLQTKDHAPSPQTNLVPPFPSTLGALAPFKQTASSEPLPKYYPSSSLRIFTLTKQWKSRHLILTSPTTVPTSGSYPLPLTFISGAGNSASHVSYLHLFKSDSADERELERLEINEDSVVFVSEEEIGGKKGVVQVAGVDLGFISENKKAKLTKKDNSTEKEDVKGREQVMWLFYIADSSEKQKWIESIKNKVLGQRTVRAGLGPSLPSSNPNEPRGDMDVMLSMRAQAMIPPGHTTSPTRSTFSVHDYTATGNAETSAGSHSIAGHDAASVSSTRSSKKARPSSSHGRNSSGAVLSLKGLFGPKTSVGHNSGRQRSNSRASGMDEWDASPTSRGAKVERTESVVSVGSSKSSILPKGNNLISILRASSPPNETSSVGFANNGPGSSLGMGIHTPAVDFAARGIQTPQSQLDRKIVQTPLVHDEPIGSMAARPLLFNTESDATHTTPTMSSAGAREDKRALRAFSVGETFSLQPAPRKRWTSTSDAHNLPILNTPSSQHLQLQESPFIKDHRDLDDFDVLGGAPGITRINPNGNGNLTPEPMSNSSPATKRTSANSASSFSFGTPPGSGNLEVDYRPRSVSSRSARSARSGRSGRSVDTPDDELDELDMPVSGFDGHSSLGRTRRTSDESSGFGTAPDVDKRSSMSSGQRSSGGVIQGKRWSRQLPKRLTPPSGPPPAAPSTPPGSPGRSVNKGKTSSPVKSIPKSPSSHPYGGAATERRASMVTTQSARSASSRPSSSHSSVVSNLPSFSAKRASVSSAISASSATSIQSSGTTSGTQLVSNGFAGHSRPTSSHRSSVPPPPRPAPTFALPPAPGETSSSPSTTQPSTSARASFRDSIASRAFRLSLMAPKPPPAGVLPPRPDELENPKSPTSSLTSRNTHRRSHSGNVSPQIGGPGSLYSIPGSPVPPPALDALPPTPSPGGQAPSRLSIKQRLRILSAPSPSSAPASPRSVTRPLTMMAPAPSPPGTPTFNNNFTNYFAHSGSFHAVPTPTTPSLPAPKIHSVEDEPEDVLELELVSLSPPPRRGSKRISIAEVEPSNPPQEESSMSNSTTRRPSVDDTNNVNKPFSLSRPASVISFGVVNV
ncbi:hypothetical protein EV360DRAFT_73810 [Lentinula raphanica]|nr:hypothetical protein EV360DRAFT_73810 [Lentinula raphanica]